MPPAVEQLDHFEHGDLVRFAGEGVAALHAALGTQDARAPQHREELLEELHGNIAPTGELTDRHRAGAAGTGELGQRADRVRRLRRDREHVSILTRASAPAPVTQSLSLTSGVTLIASDYK